MHLSHILYYVRDLNEAVDFFKRVFGLEERFTGESGFYAEMVTGETALAFITEEYAEKHLGQKIAPLGGKLQATEIVFSVDDVESLYNRALEFGAESIAEPQDKPWGQKIAYVRAPFGLHIEIASPLTTSA